MLTKLVTRPARAFVALIELPLTARKSLEEVNQLLEVSRRQLETMQRSTDSALDQAERMNELLGRVVRLTEPIEKAQRGGEYFADGLRRVIFGEETTTGAAGPVVEDAGRDIERADTAARAAAEAELAAGEAQVELAAAEAERAALEAESAAVEAGEIAIEGEVVAEPAENAAEDAEQR